MANCTHRLYKDNNNKLKCIIGWLTQRNLLEKDTVHVAEFANRNKVGSCWIVKNLTN